MSDLAKKKCKPSEGGVAPLTAEQTRPMLKRLQGWKIEGGRLTKSFSFGAATNARSST